MYPDERFQRRIDQYFPRTKATLLTNSRTSRMAELLVDDKTLHFERPTGGTEIICTRTVSDLPAGRESIPATFAALNDLLMKEGVKWTSQKEMTIFLYCLVD